MNDILDPHNCSPSSNHRKAALNNVVVLLMGVGNVCMKGIGCYKEGKEG
jgi:hypothetical protein